MIKLKHMLLTIIIVIIICICSIGYITYNQSILVGDIVTKIDKSNERVSHLVRILMLSHEYTLNPNESTSSQLKKRIDLIEELSPDSPKVKEKLELLSKHFKRLQESVESKNFVLQIRERMYSKIQNITNQLIYEIQREINILNKTIHNHHKAEKELIEVFIVVTIFMLILILLGATKNILIPLDWILKGIQEIEKGNFGYQLENKMGILKEAHVLKNMINKTSKTIKENFTEIENSNQLIKNMIDAIPLRIWWKDIHGNYRGANKFFIEDIGLNSLEELVGKNDFDIHINKKDAKKYRDDDLEVIRTGKSKLSIEETQETEEGIKSIVTSKVPMLDANNQIIGTLGVFEDVTEKKKMYQELKEKDEIMLAQSRHAAMGEMISMIAHQWRQPLSVISMYVNNLLLDIKLGSLDEKNVENFAKKVSEQTQELSKTIDDFKNFFKPQKISEVIKIQSVLDEAFRIVGKSLENHEVCITLDNSSNTSFETYSRELMQVVINILTNAKDSLVEHVEKDNDNRAIHVKAYESKESLYIEISDNGGGIKQELLDKIFEPYFSTKEGKNGTGLGLYMCKTIIEKHLKGSIFVHNTPKGACFTLKLPLHVDKSTNS